MRNPFLSLSFRAKVVLLAVLLVAIQLGTVFPGLGSIKAEQEIQAERTVQLAGAAFEQYMQNRSLTQVSLADVLVKDFAIREAVARGNTAELEDALGNLAARGDFLAAAAFDMSGKFMGGIGAGRALEGEMLPMPFASDPSISEPVHAIALIGGMPYQTVSVPVRAQITAPEAIGWLTLGFPVDGDFAKEVSALTGLETTFVSFGIGRTVRYATTLDSDRQAAALAGVHLGEAGGDRESVWGEEFITLLRPVLTEDDALYVAIQLPMQVAMRSYFTLRNVFLVLSGFALLATMAAAFWLSRMVTSPIGRLVDAARRMADGIYNQRIEVKSQDEFAVLAQGFNAMQQAISNREQDIVHMAHHDSLSGLPTREIIVSDMRNAIASNHQVAVINFVLHRFDEFASSLGHRTADQLIQLVAGRLRDQLEDGQILGHLNYQEFVLVLPGADLDEAEAHVREMQALLRSGLALGNANLSLQIRAGISLFPQHGVNASELLRCAGVARGRASHHLGSVGIYESGQEEKSLALIRIIGDFPGALQKRELSVEYQPKVECDSLALSGAEALVRWQHPDLGILMPDAFIAAIEQAGGISQLTRWVLDEAARTMASWATRGLAVPISVNVSADDLIGDYLPRFLEDLCSRYGIEPGTVTLEITESAMMHDVESALAVVSEIRRLGFRFAIDDFGTGHSALAQLKRLAVDELKIDKSFVLNIEDQRDEAIVRTAIELAHKFGLQAVAEGVEDEACLNRLRHLGCESAQGFFFSKPLPAEAFHGWARAWEAGYGADILSLVEPHNPPRRAGE